MDRYVCLLCGYTYDPKRGDPENGVAPGTPGPELPVDWVCPRCKADLTHFARRDD